MKIHIKTPFYSAWKMYGWEKDVPGIGINKATIDALKTPDEKLLITVGKDTTIFYVTYKEIHEAKEKYKSHFHARRGVHLIVIPQNILKRYEETGRQTSTG